MNRLIDFIERQRILLARRASLKRETERETRLNDY